MPGEGPSLWLGAPCEAADAAAICEAVQRPNMRFVPPKSIEQQSQLMVHRARQGFVAQRTATINRIRGLLSEFGHVLPLKADTVRRQAGLLLEELPGWANTVIGDLLSELHHLDERIAGYDRHIAAIAREDARAQQLIGSTRRCPRERNGALLSGSHLDPHTRPQRPCNKAVSREAVCSFVSPFNAARSFINFEIASRSSTTNTNSA